MTIEQLKQELLRIRNLALEIETTPELAILSYELVKITNEYEDTINKYCELNWIATSLERMFTELEELLS